MPKLADLFRAHYLADGVDFDSIRVHYTDTAGAGADPACRALGARAFTAGPDIYFAAGQFRPGTRSACGCSRTRSPTWCSSPRAWSARSVRVMIVRVRFP